MSKSAENAKFASEIEPIAAKYGLRVISAAIGNREDQESAELLFPSSAGNLAIVYRRGLMYAMTDVIIENRSESFGGKKSPNGSKVLGYGRVKAFETAMRFMAASRLWAHINRRVGTKRIRVRADEDAIDLAQQAVHELDAVLERYGLVIDGVVLVLKK